MQSTAKSPAVALAAATRPSGSPIWLRLLNWLAERDRHYREAQKLRNLPDERLVDMGLGRKDAEAGHRP